MTGLAIVVPAAKLGWFMPPKERLWDFGDRATWDPDWVGIEFDKLPSTTSHVAKNKIIYAMF